MILISHRGNINGRNAERENNPDYIEEAIAAGYNVEVDVWLVDGKWMLGHDFPKDEVPLSFFERPEIWTHAKNLIGYVSLYNNSKAHVFWHNKDDFTFTSKGIKWAKTHVLTHDGVMVLPEFNDYHTQLIQLKQIDPLGICSDNFAKLGL
jgi:hypothetical protein